MHRLIPFLFLTGCMRSPSIPRRTEGGEPSGCGGSGGSELIEIAWYLNWAGAATIVCSIVVLGVILKWPRRAFSGVAAGFSIIGCGIVLQVIGAHMGWFLAILGLLGVSVVGFILYRNKQDLLDKADNIIG